MMHPLLTIRDAHGNHLQIDLKTGTAYFNGKKSAVAKLLYDAAQHIAKAYEKALDGAIEPEDALPVLPPPDAPRPTKGRRITPMK